MTSRVSVLPATYQPGLLNTKSHGQAINTFLPCACMHSRGRVVSCVCLFVSLFECRVFFGLFGCFRIFQGLILLNEDGSCE